MNTEALKQLYRTCTGHDPQDIVSLPGAGSNRRYFRLNGHPAMIGVCGTSTEENRAFIYLARHFREKKLPVPEVYAVNDDNSCYLQEDLGDMQLFQAIERGRMSGIFNAEEKELLQKTIRLLPQIQFQGAQGIDFGQCYPQAAFDRRCVYWDLNYFKYCFLKACELEFQENLLENDFERMADILLAEPSDCFMYRDFQSRNVMIYQGNPYFIDFQGGRRGPVYYDVASFVWQAKANYTEELRNDLLHQYLDALHPYRAIPPTEFMERLKHFVLFRTLQVLGAYGFRGYFERKPHFIESVPYAIRNLVRLLDHDFPEYPYLCPLLRQLTNLPRFARERNRHKLTVRVMSFSYRKGIPEDSTGNGGGYVFDCRAIHNPGKYERYQKMTGRDAAVISFLEEDGEILRFLNHVDALVDAHVERYLERGFSNLSVCFGCTGGQHRSVYSAQHVAEHLHQKYGIAVHLIHREQNMEENFPLK